MRHCHAGAEFGLLIGRAILARWFSKTAEEERQSAQILVVQKSSFGKDAEPCGLDKVLIDTR